MQVIVAYAFLNVYGKITSFCQVLKKMHTKENWFLFFCLTVELPSNLEMTELCMLGGNSDSRQLFVHSWR